MNNITKENFTTDWEKMYDFWRMTRYDFLDSYSYVTEEEYDNTTIITINRLIEYDEIPTREED